MPISVQCEKINYGRNEPCEVIGEKSGREFTFCDEDCKSVGFCELCRDNTTSADGTGAYAGGMLACDDCGAEYLEKMEEKEQRRLEKKAAKKAVVNKKLRCVFEHVDEDAAKTPETAGS